VYSEKLLMIDRGIVRNMFYSKNKFEKLVYLVGFIVGTQCQCRSHQKIYSIAYLEPESQEVPPGTGDTYERRTLL
jgi:hypothetical protein